MATVDTQMMTAVVLPGVGLPPQPTRVPRPSAGPGEAVVAVDACGVCGSDVFLQDGGFGVDLPVVPGHEAAGRVIAVGDAADSALVGRQVAVYYLVGPPDSPWVRAGRENIGPGLTRMGVDVDGAWAEYVVRPVRSLVPVDPPLDPAVVAVATDALATPYHALTTVARLQAGESVVVIGPGGIGSSAVQIATLLGARVTAVGRSATKLALAGELGATATLTAGEGRDAIVAAAGGQVDVVVQCAGENPALDRLAVEVAGFGGRVVLVAADAAPFEVRSIDLIAREASVSGSRGFTRADIRAVLDLVRAGRLRTDHLTAIRRPLHEAAEALADLRAGRVMRTVLIPRPRPGEESSA